MNKIYIFFDNYKYQLVTMNIASKLISIDDKIIHITDDDIYRFKYILKCLKETKNGVIFDPVRFTINYENGDSFSGNSNTNKNFNLLNDWLGDINGR